MAKYLLDTTALIDHLHGRPQVVDLLTSLASEGDQLGVCCINVAELYAGLSRQDQRRADRLVTSLEFFEMGREIAIRAGQFRYDFAGRGVTLTIADALIAATAIQEEAILITANVRDFPMKELRLLQQP